MGRAVVVVFELSFRLSDGSGRETALCCEKRGIPVGAVRLVAEPREARWQRRPRDGERGACHGNRRSQSPVIGAAENDL